jgi:hypothetical protein
MLPHTQDVPQAPPAGFENSFEGPAGPEEGLAQEFAAQEGD